MKTIKQSPHSSGRRTQVTAIAVTAVCIAVFPNLINGYFLYLGTQMAIFAIACLGLTVVIGWCGQVVLAQAGFLGIGAYGTAFLHLHGVPWALAAAASALLAASIGALIGMQVARLRGFYLAIATLAFGELLAQVFNIWTPVTGGPFGLAVPPLQIGSLDSRWGLWYLSAATLAITVIALWHFSRTRWGRCLRAVRDVEVAAGSFGISATKYKAQAFAVSALLGALAGSLFGQSVTYLAPDSFTLKMMIAFLIVVLVGGVDRIAGALFGAFFLVAIQEAFQSTGAYQRIAFGIALLLVVRFLPNGVVPLIHSVGTRLIGGLQRNRTAQVSDPAPPSQVVR